MDPAVAPDPVDAGPLGAWLAATGAALHDGTDADVPCGSCTACCSSSQFVMVGPDEHDARAHIPPALLFPAPRAPAGTMLLGYDQRGRCPMLGERGCTIYEHRPRTCRTYDCRVFPAAGLVPDQPAVAERAGRWRFAVVGAADEAAAEALHAAAGAVRELPAADAPRSALHAAVLTVRRAVGA